MEEEKRTVEKKSVMVPVLSEMLTSGIPNREWTRATHLYVTIKDRRGCVMFGKYYTSRGHHAEINMLGDQEFLQKIQDGVVILMTSNYSPCSECATKLITFHNDNKTLIQKFTIQFSHLYRVDEMNNRGGLLYLHNEGFILEAMTKSSWFDVLVSAMFGLPPESVRDRDEDTKKKLENILRARSD